MTQTTSRNSGLLTGLFATAALCSLAVAPLHAQSYTTIVDENFEAPRWTEGTRLTGSSQDTYNWWGNDNDTTMLSRVVAAPSGSPERIGGQSLYLLDSLNTGTPNASAHITGAPLSQGYVELDLKRGIGSSLYVNFYAVGDSSATTFTLALTGTESTGNFILIPVGLDESDRKTVAFSEIGFVASDWNTLRIVFDDVTKALSVEVNGTAVSGLSYAAGEVANANFSLGYLNLRAGYVSGTNHSAYIDNVIVAAAVPESSTVALAVSALAAGVVFVARRRKCVR